MWLINGMQDGSFTLLRLVSTRNVTRWTLCIRLHRRIPLILPDRIVTMVGEKLFSERMYQAYYRNKGLDVRIARFHNIFGPEGTWEGGREKSPAAFCRKVAETPDGGTIEMWGDGNQTRSFLYIDECLEGVRRLMSQDEFMGPVNIGSDEMISINGLAEMVMGIAGKKLNIVHIPGPLGVMGRNSDNRLIKENWDGHQAGLCLKAWL